MQLKPGRWSSGIGRAVAAIGEIEPLCGLVDPSNVCTRNGVAWYADDPDEGQRAVVVTFMMVSITIIAIVA